MSLKGEQNLNLMSDADSPHKHTPESRQTHTTRFI